MKCDYYLEEHFGPFCMRLTDEEEDVSLLSIRWHIESIARVTRPFSCLGGC